MPLLLSLVVLSAQPGEAPPGWFAGLEAHGTLLSGVAERSLLGVRFGGALRGGRRFEGHWGLAGLVESNLWLATELSRARVLRGALNLGVGPEFRWVGDHLRASLLVGPSILLTPTLLDAPGSVGVFVTVTPAQLAWAVRSLRITLSVLSLSIVAPVLRGIPLVDVQFRTTVGVEVLP
ncbi:MAG: hypothetical protein INH41_01140 [Myxococcaceae bacterium]|nr:hypothetical protein [Myxococcaceae bacterium]MCA3010983.1 hypothetical protein [Myxococcaceae bacterium]